MTGRDEPEKSFEECRETVRQYDRDRYMLSLFCPAGDRPALWSLFAFNSEIAKTREVVSETQLGLIRLQWWREAIGEIYDGKPVRKHPVLIALKRGIETYALPRESFETLIYAREFDLEDVPPASFEGLMTYADFTNTPLLQMTVKILSGGDIPGVEESPQVKNIACAYGLVGLIRSIPVHLRQRRCYLPADLMEKYETDHWRLYNGKDHDVIPVIVSEIMQNAEMKDIFQKPENRKLLRWWKFVMMCKKDIEKTGGDPFEIRERVFPMLRLLNLKPV